MHELQVALALAVSMLIASTLVTMVVEIIYRVLHVRNFGLKFMLETFYQNAVKQRFHHLLDRKGATSLEDESAFVGKMTALMGGSHTLSTIEFVRRLADTQIGKNLARRVESEIDALIDDLTERYEDYGRRANLLFRRWSQVVTVVLSVIMALALNINVVTLIRTFYENEPLARTIAGHAEQAMAAYQVQADLLKTAQSNVDSTPIDVDAEMAALKQRVQELKKAAEEAKSLGLPVGWSKDKFFNADDIKPLDWGMWFLTTLLTGLLIGLGGPFWFDIIKKLSVVSQLAGALVRQPAVKSPDGETAPAPTTAAAIAIDPKVAFKAVVSAQRVIDGAGIGATGFMGPKALRL